MIEDTLESLEDLVREAVVLVANEIAKDRSSTAESACEEAQEIIWERLFNMDMSVPYFKGMSPCEAKRK